MEILTRTFDTMHEAYQFVYMFDDKYWNASILETGNIIEVILIQV